MVSYSSAKSSAMQLFGEQRTPGPCRPSFIPSHAGSSTARMSSSGNTDERKGFKDAEMPRSSAEWLSVDPRPGLSPLHQHILGHTAKSTPRQSRTLDRSHTQISIWMARPPTAHTLANCCTHSFPDHLASNGPPCLASSSLYSRLDSLTPFSLGACGRVSWLVYSV
jgi:hypothetical protein